MQAVARLVAAFGAASALALFGVGCGDDSNPVTSADGATASTSSQSSSGGSPGLRDQQISVVIPADAGDPFFKPMQNAAKQAGQDLGISVDYQSTQKFDVTEEKRLLEAAIAKKPDGIVVFVPDPDALGPSVEKATSQGIPVVFITSGQEAVKKLGALFYIGEDATLMGERAGEILKRAGVTKAICVNHSQGTVTLDQRCAGFAKGISPGSSKVVVVDGTDPTVVRNRIEATLQSDSSIQGIFTLGPPGAEPAVDALDALGKAETVKLVTTDLSDKILQSVENGKILAALDQQQYLQVYDAIVHLTLWNRFKVRPVTDIITAPNPITKANAADVIALTKQGIR